MIKKVLYAGISEDISDLSTKANYFKNRILIITIFASIFFIIQTYINPTVEAHIQYKAYVFNGIPLILYCLAFYGSFREKHFISKLILLITANGQITAASLLMGRNTGFDLYLIILCVIPYTIFIVERRLKYIFSLFSLLLLVAMEVYFHLWYIKPIMPPIQATIGYLTTVTLVPTILLLIIYDLQKTNIRIEQSLMKERKKSENLLMNILPVKVSEELKSGKQVIADDYEDASVLFADIVGFTKSTANVTAVQVANELNNIYFFIDDLIDKFKLEKIKTIGDSYMVASGLPQNDSNHLENLIDFALYLREEIKKLKFMNRELQLRIGINAGPVVAGVLGKRKYIYDIWGETVNIASRMESSGVEGQIQISSMLYERVRRKYHCEKRGEVYIKGIGEVETYFIIYKKSCTVCSSSF